MDLGRREVGRGEAADVVLVAALAFRQGFDGEVGAAVGDVVLLGEGGEGFVGGQDDGVDDVGELRGEALFVGIGEGGRELLEWQQEGVGVDDTLALLRDLGGKELDGDEVVANAGEQDLLGLV